MIGQRLVIVADAHFARSPTADEEAFLAFVDAVPTLGDSLLLAGDIFDFWFTYRRTIPRQAIRVTAAIIQLARRMPVLMLGGNHDRWGDTFWSTETGVRFDPRELRFAVGPRHVRAVHGDGLHDERSSATALNRLLATRGAIATFRALPTSLGFLIADALGHKPAFGRANPAVIDQAAERQSRWAERALASDPGLGAVIMGHTHRGVARDVGGGRWYINPGPWTGERSYAVLDGTGARLVTFS
ncbi:MAG TPA: metallophosphoesterase [Gemmatimonadales bacterium]|nr:metallophosphoesterase [Gemmatimonadales bacterium]